MKKEANETKKIEQMSVNELLMNISSFKENLTEIEESIKEEKEKNPEEKNNATLKSLENLKSEVLNALEYFKKNLSYKVNEISFNTLPIQLESIGKIASIYNEKDRKWYNGLIKDINEKKETCKIIFFGDEEENLREIPFKYIKLNDEVSDEDIFPNAICNCLYKGDGLYYTAKIKRISELGIHIKYIDYDDEDIVSKDYVKISPEQKIENYNRKYNINDKVENKFILPEKFKIKPNDNEETRLLKRKRVKKMKYKFKQNKLEEICQEKQQNWIDFNKNLNSKKNKNKAINGFTPMRLIQK
jgi:hypothetical protein